MTLFAARISRGACLVVALLASSTATAVAGADTVEYRVLATNKTSTMEKEMQDAACQASRELQDEQQAEKQYRELVAQQWPLDDIAASLKLNDSQRGALEVVQDTTMGTMEALSACPPKDALTPPARLKAAKARLEAMREAIRSVNDAVDDFYADLSDEQKTQFEGLGPNKRGV